MTFFELRGLAITKICKKTNQNKKWLFSQIFLQCNVSCEKSERAQQLRPHVFVICTLFNVTLRMDADNLKELTDL